LQITALKTSINDGHEPMHSKVAFFERVLEPPATPALQGKLYVGMQRSSQKVQTLTGRTAAILRKTHRGGFRSQIERIIPGSLQGPSANHDPLQRTAKQGWFFHRGEHAPMQELAAERVAFFDELVSAYERAEARTGCCEHRGLLAGHHIHLRSAGAPPLAKILPSLEHWAAAGSEPTDLTVYLWDNASTGTRLPLILQTLMNALSTAGVGVFEPRMELRDFSDARIMASFRTGPCNIMNVFDRERRQAIYWLDNASKLPYWETASPLQCLLNCWAESKGMQYLHAAAVGSGQGAVLLTGKGGSGKSSTALACLGAGMGYLADDYCLAGKGRVYSLYTTAKLVGESDLERFPELASWVENPDRAAAHKILLNVFRQRPSQMVMEAPIKAVIAPRIPDHPLKNSELRRVTGSRALLALAPTTLFQLAGTSQSSLTRMSALLRDVPAYVLEVGTDVAKLAEAVRGVLNG
jgi:hypothetical protein